MIEQSTTYDKCRSCFTFNIVKRLLSVNFSSIILGSLQKFLSNTKQNQKKSYNMLWLMLVDFGVYGMVFLAYWRYFLFSKKLVHLSS